MSSQFKVSLLTVSDIPGASAVFFASFNSPKALVYFPPNASGKQWFADSITAALKNPELGIVHVVVTDESASTEERGRKVVAHSIWVKHSGGKLLAWDQRWRANPPEGVTREMLGEEFFAPMVRQHEKNMGERPHYFLETLSTDPEYRKRGLASMLLQWGTKHADELGWECYLDAAEAAAPLYRKHGFVQMPETDPGTTSLPMVRPVMKEFS
ncbi:hypothetical protein VTL71DRAFT_4785 [Oculimacula yallundae]|uniref:N-acetyltransferase domain-containing protein n=1 Tax=Oculimacula yallundae TaxID=86028 RepID=A0ABR4C4M3_9HELO